jgi:hypothetical protein
MRNGFDLMRADTYVGKWGGGSWRWKSRVLWAPVKLHEPIGECNLGPKKNPVLRIQDPVHFLPLDPGSGIGFFTDPGSPIPDPKPIFLRA